MLEIYKDADGARSKEIQNISTGDPLGEFYKQLSDIKSFHHRYPNEPVENLERAYKKKTPAEGEAPVSEIDNMFTGEEAYGRFLDLTGLHELYVNLPGIKRPSYLQYLDIFDVFSPPVCAIKRPDKLTDQYFTYVGELASYLASFMRRTRPLENLDALFATWDADFDTAWTTSSVPGWGLDTAPAPPNHTAIYCADCERDFANPNVHKAHLTGKKHIRAAAQRAARLADADAPPPPANGTARPASSLRLKERAIAERENRVRRLAAAMTQERADTRVNVERRAGMTERERQLELEALFAEGGGVGGAAGGESGEESEGEDEDRVYNPLKLPLAWDGKPIPFWLYKLHGLGVEFPCEICGNFVYMGRRAFDKHFNEARHIHGLKCLGVTNTALFREITGIEDALKLWDKLQREKRREEGGRDVVQMEDAEGNVMPEKVYYDLQKQGLL